MARLMLCKRIIGVYSLVTQPSQVTICILVCFYRLYELWNRLSGLSWLADKRASNTGDDAGTSTQNGGVSVYDYDNEAGTSAWDIATQRIGEGDDQGSGMMENQGDALNASIDLVLQPNVTTDLCSQSTAELDSQLRCTVAQSLPPASFLTEEVGRVSKSIWLNKEVCMYLVKTYLTRDEDTEPAPTESFLHTDLVLIKHCNDTDYPMEKVGKAAYDHVRNTLQDLRLRMIANVASNNNSKVLLNVKLLMQSEYETLQEKLIDIGKDLSERASERTKRRVGKS
jgi:hypothetical protein